MDLLGWGQQAGLQGAFCSVPPPFPAGYFTVLLGGSRVVLGCLQKGKVPVLPCASSHSAESTAMA